jgi:hypothetical protein
MQTRLNDAKAAPRAYDAILSAAAAKNVCDHSRSAAGRVRPAAA